MVGPRTKRQLPQDEHSTAEARLPAKKVAFERGKDLLQGPSGSGNADTRATTPSRSAMHTVPDPPTDDDEDECELLASIDPVDLAAMSRAEVLNELHRRLVYIREDARRTGNLSRKPEELADLLKLGTHKRSLERLPEDFLRQQLRYLSGEQAIFDDAYGMSCGVPGTRHVLNKAPLDSPAAARKALAAAAAVSPARFDMAIPSGELAKDSAANGDEKDAIICNRLSNLLDEIREFSISFPKKEELVPDFFEKLLVKENQHLLRYLTCLAIAGKNGEKSWRKLLTESSSRSALVMGIVGRALKAHVFADLWFGGTPEEAATLAALEEENIDMTDGFERTETRAKQVQQYAGHADETTFKNACAKVALQLENLLTPFWDGQATYLRTQRHALRAIVTSAANLSRDMRLAPDVIYYWPPTFKDEEFDPSRMECLNLKPMILESPYTKQKVNNFDRTILAEGHAHRSEAIVRIVCFPGIVAYRKGGGELAHKQLAEEKTRGDDKVHAPPDVVAARRRIARNGMDTFHGTEGIRSKVICKSVVYLAWDRQRLLTKEAGTSAHIDAQKPGGSMQKYDDDYKGFVELIDVARRRWMA